MGLNTNIFTYSCFHSLESLDQLVKPLDGDVLSSAEDLPILLHVYLDTFYLRIGQNKETHSKSN